LWAIIRRHIVFVTAEASGEGGYIMQAAMQDLDCRPNENDKIAVRLGSSTDKAGLLQAENADAPILHLFESSQQISLAERYPKLMCVAIAFCLLATALMGEVECLRVSGYFWR
jgi:hypothetical protein